ncbi:MAG: hypothetical protein H7270_04540 [Dermatophilaceae bacterium]|nr:hypothetical protein [Dermatophilaceae bacterium]
MTVENPSSAAPMQPLVQIGDISVDQHWVHTPAGWVPTSQATWTVQDMTLRAMVIPTYAIVLAIVTSVMTCLLGLLFLLIKEDRPTGWVQTTVHGPDIAHTTQVPVSRQEMVLDVCARVDYARSLTAAAQS